MVCFGSTHARHSGAFWILVTVGLLCSGVVVSESAPQSADCKSHEYEHEGYCCNRCLPGYKMSSPCPGPNMTTTCMPCAEKTFLAISNYNRNCFRCRKCDKLLNQVEVAPCKGDMDRVCGCPDWHYKVRQRDSFNCVRCQTCSRGSVIAKPCLEYSNTVCKCSETYFRDGKGDCHPCSECDGGFNCTVHCPKPNQPDHKPWMIIAVVMSCLLAGCFVYEAAKNSKKILQRCKKPYASVNMEQNIFSTSELVPSVQQTDLPSPVHERTCLSMPDSAPAQLPDCVPQITNSPEFLYAVVSAVPVNRWKEFVRRLGLSDREMECVERDQRCFQEAQYEMMKLWRNKKRAPQQSVIMGVLRGMGLEGCAEELSAELKWQA
ncbi:tumor necrosis factor receptor superfamily member 1A-like [Polyodon spathula]|uniref:tumor necrosis factor receptor superfamily member 1A-like n=1 Tax=Polyodon spathula TaxID=7913 RepID=UPI001B7F377D|nr:tumor necrosis factor receptor superfamily member 1A-like [Polyodon spathula]